MTEKKCGNCRGDLPELCKGIWACGDVEKIQTELSQAKIEAEEWKQWAEKLEMDIQYYLFLAQTSTEHKSCDSCNEMFKETLSNFQKFKESKGKP